MRPKRLLIFFSMLLAMFCPAFAQGYGDVGGGSGGSGAPDGSYWSDGNGGTAHLDVTENPSGSPPVWTTTTSAGGFTNAAGGTAGPDTPSGLDTCRNSGTMTNASGEQYRVRNGKLEKKGADGKWKRMRKIPKPKNTNTTRQASFAPPQHLTAGDPAPFDGTLRSDVFGEVALAQNERAPWEGWLYPSDDVVSLPVTVP